MLADTLETTSLTDLYVLLSDVQHEADRLRQTTRESLLARLGPDQELHGTFGTVRRTTREQVEGEEGAQLREELRDLEARLEQALSA